MAFRAGTGKARDTAVDTSVDTRESGLRDDSVSSLQRAIGNRATGALFREWGANRGPDPPQAPHNSTSSATSAGSKWSFPGISLLSQYAGILQRKLAIGSTHDPAEREADLVAERVTAGGVLQRKCAECEEEEKLARKESPVTAPAPMAAPPIVHDVLAQPGTPLDASTRAFFEPRFGCDFSAVRVHSNAEAAAAARSVQARAFTVGNNVVFEEGQYDPASDAGRKLLAHELTHTIQQSASDGPLQRKPNDDTIDVDLVAVDPKEAARLREQGIDLPQVSQETFDKLEKAPPTLTPATPPSGFTSAATGMAPCPDAPQATVIAAGCPAAAIVAGAAPPKKEDATVPALDESAFGGDAKVETFATSLAECRAARVVQTEVNKRFKAAVEGAKKTATAEAKTDTDKALAEAAAGIDPKDKKAVAAAKKQAATDAKTAAAKKIADAQAAVQKQDPATVKAELASAFKEELKSDYSETMHAAVNRFGGGWKNRMIAAQNKEKARLTKEKNAKPKVAKGETPPPARPAEEISAEIEAEMVVTRCQQQTWAANQIESVKRGWMVGRREKVDFDTVSQSVKELKDFKPGRAVPEAELEQVPEALRSDSKMPGVAPEVAEFLTALQALEPNFKAGNYSGHGGGSWAGAGFSVDLTLSGKDAQLDDRGFYKHDAAVRFLLNLNQAATAMGGTWRVLYNDFGVAEEVNAATGSRNVTYMGNNPKGTLNWHGPAPMVLHFHLDIQLPPPAPKTPTAAPATTE